MCLMYINRTDFKLVVFRVTDNTIFYLFKKNPFNSPAKWTMYIIISKKKFFITFMTHFHSNHQYKLNSCCLSVANWTPMRIYFVLNIFARFYEVIMKISKKKHWNLFTTLIKFFFFCSYGFFKSYFIILL